MDKAVLNDEQLMLEYANGSALAFEQLYQRHKGGLYRYCLRQLRHKSKAEECFQEIWLKLINSRVNYKPTALFTTYLYRIAQNHIIDMARKDNRSGAEVEMEPETIESQGFAEPLEALTREGQHTRLRTTMAKLPIEQKTVLLLKLDAGLSLEEIATVVDCGKETVKSRLRYAVSFLKQQLGEL
ncbi:MAG: sigma-70 family RNA polymerase sigma factor [Gammaproteobacteria bacterium]|nr:sigma-70 family RNA polymerase sigma factor [Gammaproteobacteria bacterium]